MVETKTNKKYDKALWWKTNSGTWIKRDLSKECPKGFSPKTFLKERIYDAIIPTKRKKVKVSIDEFSIPELNEYNLFLKFNYSCFQLTQICKYYKQKVSGNKNEKIYRLYNYLKYSNYATNIQKVIRGFLARRLFQIKSLGHLCKCVNDTDFLTLEEIKNIELKQLIVIKQDDGDNRVFYYAFNILSLWNLIENARLEKKKIIENPFTREQMNYRILEKKGRLIFRLTKAVYGEKINIEFKDDEEEIISLEKKYKKEVVDLFQKIDTIGNFITDTKWLLNLSKYNQICFLKELRDCWEYRLQLTNEIKRNVCPPNGRPFEAINMTDLAHRPSLYVLRRVLRIMTKFVDTGVDNKSKNLGIFYVLGALTMLSQEAANALPWMYESFMVQNN